MMTSVQSHSAIESSLMRCSCNMTVVAHLTSSTSIHSRYSPICDRSNLYLRKNCLNFCYLVTGLVGNGPEVSNPKICQT